MIDTTQLSVDNQIHEINFLLKICWLIRLHRLCGD